MKREKPEMDNTERKQKLSCKGKISMFKKIKSIYIYILFSRGDPWFSMTRSLREAAKKVPPLTWLLQYFPKNGAILIQKLKKDVKIRFRLF